MTALTVLPPRRNADLDARFGRLVVIEVDPGGAENIRTVRCDCGSGTHHLSKNALESWGSVSCGCLKKVRRIPVGTKYGSLTRLGSVKGNVGMNEWKCDCGTVCHVSLKFVRTGAITACNACTSKRKGKPLVGWERLFYDGLTIGDHARRTGDKPSEALKRVFHEASRGE